MAVSNVLSTLSSVLPAVTLSARSVLGWLGVALVLYAIYCVLYCYILDPIAWLPGPKVFHPLGQFPVSGKSKPFPYAPHIKWADKYGGMYPYRRILCTNALCVTDPEAVKYVLVSNSANFVRPPQSRKLLERLVGRGLLTVEGAEHAAMKRGISPAFAFAHLKNNYVPVFQQAALSLADAWQQKASLPQYAKDGFVEDLFVMLTRTTLDAIGLTAFGYDFNAVRDEDNRMFKAYENALSNISISLTLLIPGWHLLPTKNNLRHKDGMRVIRTKVQEIINKHKQEQRQRVSNGEAKQDEDFRVPPSQRNLLTLLIDACDEKGAPLFSDDALIDSVLTFLGAGHETTSVALSWTLYQLANNPSAQERLATECRSVLRGAVPDWSDLSSCYSASDVQRSKASLAYLDAVARESLRLYPPAPVTPRYCVSDDVICGQRVKAGTLIFISTGVMGRIQRLWGPDAQTFRPERWLVSDVKSSSSSPAPSSNPAADPKSADASDGDEHKLPQLPAEGKRHPMAWIPFLAGERACIGQRFAMLELQCILALLVQRFRFEPVPDTAKVEARMAITMRPSPGLPLRVFARPPIGDGK